MAVKAAMVRAQETAAAWVRLFNDLSAKPDICNPNDGRIPAEGSQMGSQRRQAVTDAGDRARQLMQLSGMWSHAVCRADH